MTLGAGLAILGVWIAVAVLSLKDPFLGTCLGLLAGTVSTIAIAASDNSR